MKLEGQVVLVTGAGRGIGRSVAKVFAQEGARIAVTGRTPSSIEQVATEIVSAGGDALPFALDVTSEGQVTQAVDQVMNTWGHIDLLVNNAGILGLDTPVWRTTVETWDEMMSVNLRGAFLCCRSVIPHMMEAGKGIIINVVSSSARMADDEFGPYTATKWGLAGYTTSLARSVRPYGIRVNGLNPGWVDTDMARAVQAVSEPDWSTPDDIARAALYLAADAPADMTGQFIDIFGS